MADGKPFVHIVKRGENEFEIEGLIEDENVWYQLL